ncbi:uncharacterized protein E0L32_006346 [Thyridium curvatum]|uniref:Uncharacterized protein n=1 Tax=Thyridium curvatum TaxID=1093900 RepID=A0A507B250_9PEZI|nr:uncharacterized protein E0L32_006346 [Thyridium curvatum]TPX13146.1 hypothetical protein E0L32_006346 [Thyridium curvatum]
MFWRSEEGWVTYWGHSFKWTPDHMSSEQLEPLAFTYDVLASEALDRLDELCPPERPPSPEEQPSTPSEPRAQDASSSEKEKPKKPRLQRDYYELLKENAHRDEKLRELWDQVNTVPEWVDWEQIERGQKVFYRYAGAVVVAVSVKSPPL